MASFWDFFFFVTCNLFVCFGGFFVGGGGFGGGGCLFCFIGFFNQYYCGFQVRQ